MHSEAFTVALTMGALSAACDEGTHAVAQFKLASQRQDMDSVRNAPCVKDVQCAWGALLERCVLSCRVHSLPQ